MAEEYTAVVLPPEMHGVIAAQDFAENPDTHLSEVKDFADTYDLTYGNAVGYLVEPDDDSTEDPIEDYLERRGYVLESTARHQSTPTPQVFDDQKGGADALAAVEWTKNEYFNYIHNDRFWAVGTRPVAFAANTRGALSDALNRGTVGMVDPTVILVGDIELADIIARRVPISGNTYIGPHVQKPKNYQLTGIAELGDIPTWKMVTGETPVKTIKAGYGHVISYEMLRTDGNFTMEALGEFSRMLAWLTLQEVINRGIKVVADAASAYSVAAASFDKKEYIKLVGRRRTGTSYNTVIGSLEFMAEYLAVDMSFQSGSDMPGAGSRTLIEMLVGGQRLGIRESAEVSNFAGKAGCLFDRRFMVEYIFSRNSDIEEEERIASNQSVGMYNTFDFNFKKTEYADDANATLITLT